MSLLSSMVAPGVQILADQFNKLWKDLTQNHDHSDGQGGTVAHSDLTDGVILGTSVSHLTLNKHLQGSDTAADPDLTGGDQGVHGLAASSYVMGSLDSQLVLQAGSGTWGTPVTFPVQFSTIVSVVLQVRGAAYGDGHYPTESYFTAGPTVSGFTAALNGSTFYDGFYWIAVGTK